MEDDKTPPITRILRESDGLGGLPVPKRPLTKRSSRPLPPKISKITKKPGKSNNDVEK